MLPGNVKFVSLPGISENAAWGNLGYVNGAPWGVFYKPNREWKRERDSNP